MWKTIYIAGAIGSEGGTVIYDEEYKASCRITLEKCQKCYAITCGIYDVMVHTVFCDFDHYDDLYQQMKNDLQIFIDKESNEDELLDFCKYFTKKY